MNQSKNNRSFFLGLLFILGLIMPTTATSKTLSHFSLSLFSCQNSLTPNRKDDLYDLINTRRYTGRQKDIVLMLDKLEDNYLFNLIRTAVLGGNPLDYLMLLMPPPYWEPLHSGDLYRTVLRYMGSKKIEQALKAVEELLEDVTLSIDDPELDFFLALAEELALAKKPKFFKAIFEKVGILENGIRRTLLAISGYESLNLFYSYPELTRNWKSIRKLGPFLSTDTSLSSQYQSRMRLGEWTIFIEIFAREKTVSIRFLEAGSNSDHYYLQWDNIPATVVHRQKSENAFIASNSLEKNTGIQIEDLNLTLAVSTLSSEGSVWGQQAVQQFKVDLLETAKHTQRDMETEFTSKQGDNFSRAELTAMFLEPFLSAIGAQSMSEEDLLSFQMPSIAQKKYFQTGKRSYYTRHPLSLFIQNTNPGDAKGIVRMRVPLVSYAPVPNFEIVDVKRERFDLWFDRLALEKKDSLDKVIPRFSKFDPLEVIIFDRIIKYSNIQHPMSTWNEATNDNYRWVNPVNKKNYGVSTSIVRRLKVFLEMIKRIRRAPTQQEYWTLLKAAEEHGPERTPNEVHSILTQKFPNQRYLRNTL